MTHCQQSMMLTEAYLFIFMLVVCYTCPGSAHPALVTLVRIISLLDPLIAHHESKAITSAAEAPSTIREESLPSVGLNDLEETVRNLYDAGVSLDLITTAVNSGLGASGQMVTLKNSLNEFTFDAALKASTTAPLVRDDVDDLVKYSMILDEPREDNFIERSNRDPFYHQSSSTSSKYEHTIDNNALRAGDHHSNGRPQFGRPPKSLSHRRPTHLPGRRHSSSSSMDDWPQLSFPFSTHHNPPSLIRANDENSSKLSCDSLIRK
ncbi:hypothetical protein CAPTEDRAFT_200277 [Capitella teleta]|uniref:Uncharacterized protein n=1 Tax=Capitella teleta TaxID=283909 RepID=R7UW25_CAPTE|nr:hypothetical protein CAPTEDRAFT_200277 [Capitella teleta]|eukprot:ELU10833.1 hypothetical protein CAPTEDRAFT_200277 [Capitella teleta]